MVVSVVDLFWQGDHPTALYVLCQGINGQKFMDEDDVCSTCGTLRAKKKCSACKMVNTPINCVAVSHKEPNQMHCNHWILSL